MTAVLGLIFVGVLFEGADPHAARELSKQATEVYAQAHYAQAEALYRQALEAWQQLGPDFALDRAIDTRNLGSVLRAEGRFPEAGRTLTDSLRQLQAAGAPGVEVGRAFYNLAALYRAEGDLPQAETFALRAAVAARDQPGLSAPERQGPNLILASVYIAQERMAEGERVLKSSLAELDGPLSVAAYDDLAVIAIAREDFQQAEVFARKALYFAGLSMPANHPAAAAAWNNLAQACRFQHRYLEAERAYRQALDLWENALGPSHPDVAKGLMNLGAFYHERGRESGAEVLYSRAAAILEGVYGKNDLRAAVARNELADVLRAERRYTESRKLGRATLATLEKTLPAGDVRLVRAQSNQARLRNETKPAKPATAPRSDKSQSLE